MMYWLMKLYYAEKIREETKRNRERWDERERTKKYKDWMKLRIKHAKAIVIVVIVIGKQTIYYGSFSFTCANSNSKKS